MGGILYVYESRRCQELSIDTVSKRAVVTSVE